MLNVIICSHLPVLLGDVNRIVTSFFYFSYVCASSSWAPLGTLPKPFIGFNLMTNFSGTRSMEFHQSDWFFRYHNNGIPAIRLIFQVPDRWNSINLVIEISKHSAPLHFEHGLCWTAFLAFGTPQQWISIKKKCEKITFKKFFSLFENWRFSKNYP